MNALQGYKLSGKGQEANYSSMNPGFTVSAKETVLNTRSVSDTSRLPDAPQLAVITDFRGVGTKPLPCVPPAYNYNYGFPAGKPNVSSLFGAIPQWDTPLTKIGKGDYPILEPINLYPNIPMKG